MEFSKDYPVADEGAAVILEYCDDVTFKNNRANGFKKPLAVTSSADTTTVEFEGNDGFEVRKK